MSDGAESPPPTGQGKGKGKGKWMGKALLHLRDLFFRWCRDNLCVDEAGFDIDAIVCGCQDRIAQAFASA